MDGVPGWRTNRKPSAKAGPTHEYVAHLQRENARQSPEVNHDPLKKKRFALDQKKSAMDEIADFS
jgi:hypothetical protein